MKHLFFDTETAGFNGPIMQLAWILTDENGEVLEQKCCLLRHSFDYEVNEKAFEVHGISKESCDLTGDDGAETIMELLQKMAESGKVIAHNLQFDWDMVMKDRVRCNITHPMPAHHKAFCTMKSTTDVVKIEHSNGRGYKWPKLQELYQWLFGEDFDGAHDALNDVRATARCYFELKKRGIV